MPDKMIAVIGFGNPGRLDDGLGPALAAMIEELNLDNVTVDSDYQLTVDDAATASTVDIVIFADAATDGDGPFYFRKVDSQGEWSFSSHSIPPGGVLALCKQVYAKEPQGYLLGMRGYDFNEYEEKLSEQAKVNLQAGFDFLKNAIQTGAFEEVE